MKGLRVRAFQADFLVVISRIQVQLKLVSGNQAREMRYLAISLILGFLRPTGLLSVL